MSKGQGARSPLVVILAIDVQHKNPGYPAPASTFPACGIGKENNSISPATRWREPKGFLRCKVLIASIQTAGLGTGIRNSKTMQATVAVTKYNRPAKETSSLKKPGGWDFIQLFHSKVSLHLRNQNCATTDKFSPWRETCSACSPALAPVRPCSEAIVLCLWDQHQLRWECHTLTWCHHSAVWH